MSNIWERFWLFVSIVAVSILALITLEFSFASHKVESYYLSSDSSSGSFSSSSGAYGFSCVYANISWYPDDKVFCDKDPAKVLEFLTKANESLKGLK